MTDTTLHIPKIENGTVIDHISAGRGNLVLELIQRQSELAEVAISLGLNYESIKLGRKDVLKIHSGGELPDRLAQQIAIISPGVTIKRIEAFEVARRYKIELPTVIDNLVRCRNPNCITNFERHLGTHFCMVDTRRHHVKCHHCERVFELKELERI